MNLAPSATLGSTDGLFIRRISHRRPLGVVLAAARMRGFPAESERTAARSESIGS
jgi:hypothetical protein